MTATRLNLDLIVLFTALATHLTNNDRLVNRLFYNLSAINQFIFCHISLYCKKLGLSIVPR